MSDAAKAYLDERKIPHLFEECLNRAKKPEDFTWRTFVADEGPAKTTSKLNDSPQQSTSDLQQEKSLEPPPPIAAGTSGAGDGGDKELETSAQPQSKDSGSEAPVSAESTPAQVDESAKLQKLASKTIIFVIGGPGSGKGTHCSRIAKDFGFTHLSAGELLREEKKKGNERERLIQEKMAEGLLVPPEITIGLLKTALLSHPDAVGFLIDGFPRDLGQGKLFVQQVCECSLMLMFECGDDVMMRRVLKRGKTSERVDDNEESMQKRLKNFHQDIIPILEHYQSMGKVRKINSDRSIEEVYSDVHAVLREITAQGDTSLATPT